MQDIARVISDVAQGVRSHLAQVVPLIPQIEQVAVDLSQLPQLHGVASLVETAAAELVSLAHTLHQAAAQGGSADTPPQQTPPAAGSQYPQQASTP